MIDAGGLRVARVFLIGSNAAGGVDKMAPPDKVIAISIFRIKRLAAKQGPQSRYMGIGDPRVVEATQKEKTFGNQSKF